MSDLFFKKFSQAIDDFNKGTNIRAHLFLGAHIVDNGTDFAVWAPNAQSVKICGDFNNWNGENHVMNHYKGIWHLFIEGLSQDTVYKYEITHGEKVFLKSDPYAFYSQLRPNTASVVVQTDNYQWNDTNWVQNKSNLNLYKSPVNIYEIHLGSFMQKENKNFYSYSEIAPKLTNYLLEMGYNYVELMPVCEYPLDASWGYQTTGYYSVTSRYGTPLEFKQLVDTLHSANIGVILDWVPGHFCRDSYGLYRFDGTPLYEYHEDFKTDNPGWGTANFDFTKPQVRSFLISNAIFWMEYYHIDGLRVDAVANMLFSNFGKGSDYRLKNKYGGFENIEAIDFIKKLNETIYKEFPNNIMAAEDSSDWPMVTKAPSIGGLGFTFKWNMGWMNDSLSYIKIDPIYKKFKHDKLTFPLCYAFNENFILPISHDEVVHGKCSLVEKMPGYHTDKIAQVKCFLTYMYGMPGKKLLFMGGEFAHALEWRFYESLEWDLIKFPEYSGVKAFSTNLNHIYLKNKAFWEKDTSWEGFKWCDATDGDRSIISFARFSDDIDDSLVFVCNFTPMKYENFQVGVPKFSDYQEILNSDNIIFKGNNILNRGIILPKPQGYGEMPFSVNITIPPFGGIILKPITQEMRNELE